MKLPTLIITALFFSLILQAREGGADKKGATLYNAAATQPQFIENRGQITDQHGAPRRDIDYKLSGGDVTLFVGNGQLHYQWLQGQPNSKSEKLNTKLPGGKKLPSGDAWGGVFTTYRMDVVLLGANRQAIALPEGIQEGTENYYLPAVPNGVAVHSYRKVTYKNVYPHIDWVLYTAAEGNSVTAAPAGIKYDFVVHPGGNVADIQLQYNGATGLALKDGALIATTPMGSITEQAPYTYYAGTKEMVSSRFVLQGNVLSYAVATANNSAGIVIDPTLKWATYYGGTAEDLGYGINTDTAGNVYLCGRTNSANNIATTGAYQTAIAGNSDGYVVKFNINGVRQWATYYGGAAVDYFQSVVADPNGDVYLSGVAASSGLATTGAFKTSFTGSGSSMVVKLNSSGSRVWATYFSDSSAVAENITSDGIGGIYIAGGVGTTTGGLATAGAFQTSVGGGFIAKFNTSGSRIWCTYFNGAIRDMEYDVTGNIVIAGYTTDATGVATTGTHQPSKPNSAGTGDGFIAKFSPAGSRLWGTYYGPTTAGSGVIGLYAIATDRSGNIYVGGSANCSTGVATTGAFKTAYVGPWADGVIAKFDATGNRVWGTYYGGNPTVEEIWGLTTDYKGNVYGLGATSSNTDIATTGAYQTALVGGQDVFMVEFDPNGNRLYGTYYGGNSGEQCTNSNITFAKGRISFCFNTISTTGIASTGAHQTTYGGGSPTPFDAAVAQFEVDTFLYIHQPFTDTVVCSGDTLSIPYGVTQNMRTSNNFVFELSNASGSFASGVTTMGTVTASQTGGVYNWVVPHSTAQSNLYRVRARSTGPIDTAYEQANIRITTTPQSPTATSNSPLCSGNVLNLASGSTTTGVSYSWIGPNGFISTAQNPSRNAAPTKYSGDYIVTITNANCISKDTAIVVVDSTPIAITAGNNGPLCAGSDLQLTASNTTAGATYNWSGPSFSNTTQNPTINNVGLANAGVYSVYASLGNCNTATVTTTVSVVNGPSVNIYPSPNDSICGNTTGSATFVATAINPGGTPSYQWYKNGTLVTATISNTYTATGIQTGDVFYAKLVPGTGAACNTAINSNQINMTVMPYLTPSVSISVSPDSTVWSGVMLTFTATATNAGNNPKYQWKVNGVSMAGATSNVWGASNLNDKDKVTCEVTSSYICPQPQKVTSNTITLKVKASINNLEANNISIYPNPTQTTLTVEGVAKGTMIQLKDVLGRQVIHTTATQTKTVLHTSQLTAGNYLLILTTADGEVMTEKVVKE
ncbi:MAG: SBBP repeat-containing protein [Chitinophagales bacterium]|nr:SBBP repeat-containing protein [Chitinophagales bacterium]